MLLGYYLVCFGFVLCHCAQAKDVVLKEYVIDLGSPPEERWKSVAHDNRDVIRSLLDSFSNEMTPAIFDEMSILAASSAKEFPNEYLQELAGVAESVNATIGELMVLNMLYESTAYEESDNKACTSIVATLPNGHIIHGRNLDYHVPGLNHLAVSLDFQKNGKTVYKGTTFAGYIGLLTAMKPNGYTISMDERDKGSWTDNDRESAKLGPNGILGLKIRDLLANDSVDFENAVQTLSTIELIAPCYIIIGGMKADEGAIISHNRTKAIDVWRLSAKDKRWFIVETNYDHWVKPPSSDDRRDPANSMMSSLGQKKLDKDSLYKILSTSPVFNSGTTYTTIMSASDPDMYTAWVRNL